MSTPVWLLITGLALGTFSIRLGGYLLGARLPRQGVWARALSALPGTLIIALLATQLVHGGPAEWGAAAVSLGIATLTRNLPLTMLGGLLSIVVLRVLL